MLDKLIDHGRRVAEIRASLWAWSSVGVIVIDRLDSAIARADYR